MSEQRSEEVEALIWCLQHSVGAVDWCTTGYWANDRGPDGYEIMPPANVHVVLERVREQVLAGRTR